MTGTWVFRAVRRLVGLIVGALFLAIVLLAVYVSLGRQLTPLIGNYTQWIEQRLSLMLDADVSITAISGEWHGFSPHFELYGLQIRGTEADGGAAAMSLERVAIAADIPASLRQWRLVLRNTRVEELDLRFVQLADRSWTLAGLSPDPTGTPLSVDQVFHWIQGLARLQLDDARLEFDQYLGETLRLNDASIQFQS